MVSEVPSRDPGVPGDSVPTSARDGALAGPLPHFQKPPLIEVVCGVQFEPIDGWTTSHYGLFWSRIKEEYPRAEDQMPLPRITLEDEGEASVEFGVLPPLRRVFLVHHTKNYLIQLQPYRFLHNWRKTRDSDAYPRFNDAFVRFNKNWEDFRRFLSELGLPYPRLETYELTYLNHIVKEGAVFPRDVWEFLNFYSSIPRAAGRAEPSGMELRFVWPLPEDTGRLHMVSRHGKRKIDGTDVLLVELIARGKAHAEGKDMAQWFEIAHQAIVRTFAELTTENAHQLWGIIA